mmetsp:Transcript_26466/g.50213  ORF Transcript_26466/g.50213 Transcript_26466/m.50213 type:complete len:166 (+) Transcript_26466:48-545(+)|eukprot:CAMPEP_0201601602 /NCGR_PEP_ID=MMETSP0492-20130828/2544_1 /ASSEMBLY_ACC=CAM_ASM_000837 /TAXON_ID=420259 /ORGANISM="Thalassiosira gravida, Strain GMp14c1" /LENGTH=165 /DNA_ID=CAMNT_0048064883 /DNA_START=203 /DNA_END=700 /DNA_ORIENTATION=+
MSCQKDPPRGLNRKTRNVPMSERSVWDLRHMPRFNEPLQYNHDEERRREERSQSRQSSLSVAADGNIMASTAVGKNRPRRQVNFQESVTVVPIPLRSDYSSIVRCKMFTNRVEMCENIERNLIEYTAENGDWRNTCLEEEMFKCGVTGELVHPAHVVTNQYALAE